jgi:hypothetical protein
VGDVVVNAPNDASCDNGQFCDGAETCDALLDCQAGSWVTCDDGVTCTEDACNLLSNQCEHAPDNDTCDDGNECTADRCDEVSGCANVPIVPCGPLVLPGPVASRWAMFLLAIAIVVVGVRAPRRVNLDR